MPPIALRCRTLLAACIALAGGSLFLVPVEARAEEPSFTREVMAVLSKAGCNMGTCHGNQNGKGGFKLSLRGEDPAFDYAALTRELAARRVDRVAPEQSLILRKPLGRLAHEGGVRFRDDWPEYKILRDWIAAGAPGPRAEEPSVVRLEVAPQAQVLLPPEDQVQLRVTAIMSDGERRDVTRLAVYEPSNLSVEVDRDGRVQQVQDGEATVIVRYLQAQAPVWVAFVPERPNYAWDGPPPANRVDELVFAKLRSLRIRPSEAAEDRVFLRRAYLDLLGVLPTVEEAQAFLADADPRKREALIDRLLARPEFAEQWALKWSDVLRNEEKVLDAKGVETFHGWIRDSMAEGKPLDQFARELVSARGSTYKNPPANYYRANRDPFTRAETTARLFLGVRLQCARCHNHPFDRWTQDDYYSWAAIFSRVDYEIVENKRRDNLDKHEFVGEQIVVIKDKGEVENPRTGQPAPPKLLGAETPELKPKQDRLEPLAAWLAAPENPLFAQVQVNFVWYHLMGRGLVEPIDDFRPTNPPSNPELLRWLTEDFIAHGFDLRHLVRRIVVSRTYQLSSEPNDTNAEDTTNFSRAIVYRLPAEKLLDAQTHLLDAPAGFAGQPAGMRAGQLPGARKTPSRRTSVGGGDRFLAMFGKPERLLACECERSNETTLNQAFLFLSGDDLDERLTRSGNRLERWANSQRSDAKIVDQLFWTALTRPATEEERRTALARLAASDDRLSAVQDLAWALMNAKEFIFRH